MLFLNRIYLGNSVRTWLIALGVAAAIFIVLRVLKALFLRKILKLSAKTATDVDDLVAELVRKIHFLFLFPLSLYFGSKILSLSDKSDHVLGQLMTIAVIVQGVIWGGVIFEYAIGRARAGKDQDPSDKTKLAVLSFVFKIVLWAVAVLLILDNLGIKVTALVAGLGVGGIAIALAVQSILGDLFASLSIILDKPFVIGDFIVVDDLRGTVEHIGLKTTRVRSLGGEQLVFANSDLLNSRIRNYRRMEERRIAFALGVTYQTPAEKLERIPGMIREVVEAQERCRFDRAHFVSYGDSSLNFETVYYVTVPDYVVYLDIQQAINLALFRRFETEAIEFAYPTQTIFVERSGAAPGPSARE